MDKVLEKLEAKLDRQDERLDQVNISITEIKADLKEHMRRSKANEEAVTILKDHLDIIKKEIDIRISILEKVKDRFYFLGWIVAAGMAIVETLSRLKII